MLSVRRISSVALVVGLAIATLQPHSADAVTRNDGAQQPRERVTTERTAHDRTGVATVSMLSTTPTVPLVACDDDPAWLCGSIRVPIDRAHPAGRKLSIGFTVLPHSDPSATARDALFVSDGGPGIANSAGRGFREFMFGPLTDQRDLVLVDNRGTGTSGAIDCPALQNGPSGRRALMAAIAACGRQLGADADRYGSGDVAFDHEAVRRALGYRKISYYAQSYGAVDLAAYATRFPHHLRAIIADAGVPVRDARHSWAWGSDIPQSYAATSALTCRRAPACDAANPGAGTALARLARAVRRHPVQGTARVAGDVPRAVTVDELALVGISSDLLNGGELAAAAAALARGDKAPLLRLGAESSGGPQEPEDPAFDSAGDNAAAFCNDADFVWKRSDPVPVRQAKYRHALRALGPQAFAPFSRQAWQNYWFPDLCRLWPAPDRFTPAIPQDATVTGVPVLILSGDLDSIVPTATTEELLATFPEASFRHIAGAGHPAAGFSDCARGMVQTFVRRPSRAPGSCTAPAVVFPTASMFARTAHGLRAATSLPGDGSTLLDRRVATAAIQTVRDAWMRSFRIPGATGTGPGLRGGSFDFDYASFGDHAAIVLHRSKFVRDVAVRGHATLTFGSDASHVRIRVRGPDGSRGMLTANGVFGFGTTFRAFVVTGSLGGHAVRVSVPAN